MIGEAGATALLFYSIAAFTVVIPAVVIAYILCRWSKQIARFVIARVGSGSVE